MEKLGGHVMPPVILQEAVVATTILNIRMKKKKESVNGKENMKKKQRSKVKS